MATGVNKGDDLSVSITEHVWDLFRTCVGEKTDERDMGVVTPVLADCDDVVRQHLTPVLIPVRTGLKAFALSLFNIEAGRVSEMEIRLIGERARRAVISFRILIPR